MYKKILFYLSFSSIFLPSLLAGKAHSASFTLDFDSYYDDLGNEISLTDTYRNQADSTYQSLDDGSLGNIGDLWSNIGVTITGSPNDGTSQLGLFNSNCVANGGTSSNGFTDPCNTSSTAGDPDLATGTGSYGTINYDTTPQANVLIFEENQLNGTPDDDVSGGTVTFTFDDILLNDVRLDQVAIIDDAQGSIVVNYADGSTFTQTLLNLEENELSFFNILVDENDHKEKRGASHFYNKYSYS